MPGDTHGLGEVASAPRELLRSILDHAFDAIVTIDDRGIVQTFNKSAERLFGYPMADVIGHNVSLLMPEPDHSQHDGYLARYLRTGEARIIGVGRRVSGRRKNGSTFPIDLAITEFVAGRQRYFAGIIRDLTAERRNVELAATEQHVRAILDGMACFVAVLDARGLVLEANHVALELAGLGPDEVVGRPFAQTLWLSHCGEVQDIVERAIHRAAAGGTVREDVAVRTRGDRLITMDLHFAPLRDPGGGVAQIVASGVDITDRRLAERELTLRLRQQEAVAQLGSLALKAPALGELLDAAVAIVGQVLDNELCKVLELLPDGGAFLLRAGTGWRDGLVGHALVGAGSDTQSGYTLQAGTPVIVDDLRADPRFTGPPLLHEHGVVSGVSVVIHGMDRPYGVLGTHTRRPRRFSADDVHFLVSVANVLADFIRNEQIEAQARKEVAFSDKLLESLPGIVYVLDAHGRPRRWNKALETISGYSRAEIAQMTALDFIPADERAFLGGRIRDVFEQGHASAEGHLRSKNGRLTPCLFSGVRLVTDETYLLGIALDISDRRQLEDQLRQAQKMEAFGQLASGIAHDFNNVLTVISGFSGVLLAGLPPDDPLRADIETIADAGDRAASLTQQLLAFSRQAIVEPRVVDLNRTIADMSKMLTPLIGEDIAMTNLLAPGLGFVRLDPGLFGQVLINLVVNARDAMPKGGRLTIETRDVRVAPPSDTVVTLPPGDYVMVAVTDTGEGMTPEVRNRIFEPFFTTKNVGRGSGLGLAVVHGIVKQSGGYVDVLSEPGLGTSFRIYFPAVAAPVPTLMAGPLAVGASERGAETVLLAEDEEGVRRLVRLVLEKHGYEVLEAMSGAEALRRGEDHSGPIHLLVTDVVMPGMDGRDVAEALRRRFPDIRVLFLSGYTDDAVIRRGILHDEVAFLQKPFSPAALAAKVREVLDQRL